MGTVSDTKGAVLGANTFTDLQTFKAGADIASATAVDLTAATGNTVVVTGTTPSTSLIMTAGQQMVLLPSGAWPLTYHATTMNINGGVSYTAAAGDRIFAAKDLAGVIRVNVIKQDGTAAAGTLVAVQTFTSSGTYTRSAGVLKALVMLVGGGGGGGSTATGGGGGAGGFSFVEIDMTSISSITATIGAGGAHSAPGGSGGTTSLSTHAQATGGGGGQSGAFNVSDGGIGGIGSLGDVNSDGQQGDFGATSNTTNPWAQGGIGALWGKGAGGRGAGNTGGSSGDAGVDGLIVIWEFS